MKLIDRTREIMGFLESVGADPFAKREIDRIDKVIFHRSGRIRSEWKIDGFDSLPLAHFYWTNVRNKWVRRMPYHIVVLPSGTAQACVPLSLVTSHAGVHNTKSVAVGVLGDFRYHKPTSEQLGACGEILAALMTLRQDVTANGHTELPGSSSDPRKVCPGKYFSLDYVIQMAQRINRTLSYRRLIRSGFVLGGNQ